MTLVWTPGWNGLTEPEAVSYVAAVEAADGQPLEFATAKAINDFVLGCKNDGIWNAIKASCILAGARTRQGALVPLAGTAPTNFNFVSGDYNRKTGLVGDGSTKYLNSNRNTNADPQDSQHVAAWVSTAGSAISQAYIGTRGLGSTANNTTIGIDTGSFFFRSRSNAFVTAGNSASTGLAGVSRSQGASYLYRVGGSTVSTNQVSGSPPSVNINVFSNPNTSFSDARLAFYSIGESLDLALLDNRVSTLIAQFGAVIP